LFVVFIGNSACGEMFKMRSFVEHCLCALFEFTTALLLVSKCRCPACSIFVLSLVLKVTAFCECGRFSLNARLSGILLGLRLFLNNVHQLGLQSLFILRQAVLLPSEVLRPHVKVVARGATFKKPYALLVVGFLLKLERPAVLHKFFELVGLFSTKFL
jgi:hypothetical protein